MIDLHSHILPSTDDGPSNLFESLEMANNAVHAGITHLFATPHHLNGYYVNSKIDILERVNEFNKYIQKENIPLKVYPGQELRIHNELFLTLEKDEILTLDNKGKYLLIELPSSYVPTYLQEMLYELLLKEITPIVVHPERHKMLMGNPSLLFELVREGALMQITAGSILGEFGKKAKSFSEQLIEHQLIHFIATDAHNINSRGFTLREAYVEIEQKFGAQYTTYFKGNADLLLKGQNIQVADPEPVRKKFFGIF